MAGRPLRRARLNAYRNPSFHGDSVYGRLMTQIAEIDGAIKTGHLPLAGEELEDLRGIIQALAQDSATATVFALPVTVLSYAPYKVRVGTIRGKE